MRPSTTTSRSDGHDAAPGDEGFGPELWSHYLSTELERPVRVSFGRARRHVIVARSEGRRLTVRMNAFFGEAPADVRHATARWLRSGKRPRAACRRLDQWIAEAMERHSDAAPRRRVRLRAAGRAHDLTEIVDDLLDAELDRSLPPLRRVPGITWGRRGRARRSLQLGSYDPEHDLVRVHPVLDQPAVPRFFVRYVVFHELLHAAIHEDPTPGGRTRHHGPRFRACEEAYVDYRRAIEWQEANLGALLRSARTGKDMGVRRAARRRILPGQGWLFPC